MKKRIIIIIGILIAAGAIGTGIWFYNKRIPVSDGNVVYVTSVSSLTGNTLGVVNRFAGVVEPQETLEVTIDNGRKVKEVLVKTGDAVKAGQLLFEYDLSSIQEDLQQAQLDLDRLKNEAMSLAEQISTLETEKRKAKADDQLSYTIEIETNKMNLKKNEYNQKSKQAEIEKLQSATGNTEVRSEIDGMIQKIDNSKLTTDDGDYLEDSYTDDYISSDSDSGSSAAFITILSTGEYRIKGKVNEQNRQSIVPGEPVIIRSRADSTQIWRGTMGSIDMNNGTTQDSNSYSMMMSSSDDQTSSTSYPFYVELESSEDLMLGQHVYIERDLGQEDQKDGLWLSDYYIVDMDQEEPYVWAAGKNGRLEKRYVLLGNHDDELSEYEIVDGLTEDDSIAFPTDMLQEGNLTQEGDASMNMGADVIPSYSDDDFSGGMDDAFNMDEDTDMFSDMGEEIFDMDEDMDMSGDIDEEIYDMDNDDGGELSGEDDMLVPMDEAPGMSSSADMEVIEE